MSTIGIDHGFAPEHIRAIRTALSGKYRRVKVWGVVYTMSFDRPRMNDYIRELDVISLWTWHAKDVVNLEANVARLEKLFPRKPIVVGLYLHDYGEGRTMPPDLHTLQCETALKLLHARRIQGIVFLTIDRGAGDMHMPCPARWNCVTTRCSAAARLNARSAVGTSVRQSI